MKRGNKISIFFYIVLALAYLSFILCWIYIFQSRADLNGQMITVQEAKEMEKFSNMTGISERLNYLVFLIFIWYEWAAGGRKLKLLVKKGLAGLMIMALSGGIMLTGYKFLIPSAKILMNFFEPIFMCGQLLILSIVLIGISKPFRG